MGKKEGFSVAENPLDISYLGTNPGIHEYLQVMHHKVISMESGSRKIWGG